MVVIICLPLIKIGFRYCLPTCPGSDSPGQYIFGWPHSKSRRVTYNNAFWSTHNVYKSFLRASFSYLFSMHLWKIQVMIGWKINFKKQVLENFSSVSNWYVSLCLHWCLLRCDPNNYRYLSKLHCDAIRWSLPPICMSPSCPVCIADSPKGINI